MLGSAIPRAPSATDVKPWQTLPLRRVGARERETPRGWQERPKSLRVESNLRLPFGSGREGSARPVLPRLGRRLHRPAGSWANDHGVAADLSCNASTRVNVLTTVSAIRQTVQGCAPGRGRPYLRLRELRVYAYLACEIHRRLRSRRCQLSQESEPCLKSTWSVPRDARGASSACGRRVSLRRTTALIASAAAHPAVPRERADGSAFGLATTAEASGQAVSLRTQVDRLRSATRNVETLRRSSALGRVARSHRLRAVCTRDATTRSITVASATVWLLGRKPK